MEAFFKILTTDKLSKFVVLLGILLIGARLYITEKYIPTLASEYDAIEDKKLALLHEEMRYMAVHMPMDEVQGVLGEMIRRDHIEVPAATPEERERFKTWSAGLTSKVLRRCAHPQNGDERARSYWTHALKITVEDYDKMLADREGDNVLNRTIRLNQTLLPEAEQMFHRKELQWTLKEKYAKARWWSSAAPVCGFVLLAGGATLWWREDRKQKSDKTTDTKGNVQEPDPKPHQPRKGKSKRRQRLKGRKR
jgi:hypothetical protein